MDYVVYLLGLLLAVAIAYGLLRSPADFVIKVDGQRVDLQGRLPRAAHAAICEFFRTEFSQLGRLRVTGVRQKQTNRLMLKFRGTLTPGDRQRIRNFLLSSL